MFDWSVAASLATAGGTLVLAVATFASVRSANRSSRTSEHAFEVGQRPLLFPSRLDDSMQKIRWGDDHWAALQGGRASMDAVDGNIYLAMSLRNVGSGIAVLHSWRAEQSPRWEGPSGPSITQPDPGSFRPQSRDLYVPPGDVSFWQAAIRDDDDPDRAGILEAVDSGRALFVDLLYSDHEGGQRTISRFLVSPLGEEHSNWLCAVTRHWYLDRPSPR